MILPLALSLIGVTSAALYTSLFRAVARSSTPQSSSAGKVRALEYRAGFIDETERRSLTNLMTWSVSWGTTLVFAGTAFVDSFETACIAVFLAPHLFAIGAVTLLETARRSFHARLLGDMEIFAQQLIMISLSGDPLETGVRKIWYVSSRRKRNGPIERILDTALARRTEFATFEEALLFFATIVDSRELRRAIQLKIESDKYGSKLSNAMRDLIEQARIKAIRIRYFDFYSGPDFTRGRRNREAAELLRLLLAFSQRLARNNDSLTCLVQCRETLEDHSLLAREIDELTAALERGKDTEAAIARFASNFHTHLVDLFVQALILSELAPRVLREMLEVILVFAKREVRETL